MIGLCAGLAAILAFVYFGFLIQPPFKATATLVIVPPSVSSELQPEELTLQGYQRLLESDAVRAQTRSRVE